MKKILVCTNYRANPNNPSCAARDSKEILGQLKREFSLKNLSIEVESSPCMGYCDVGPNAHLIPNGPFLHGLSTQKLGSVITKTRKFLED